MDELYPPATIAAGLASLARRWPHVESHSREQPVFVLAAGWRSGSTLVQRALFSECFLWGEPFGHAGLIEHLTDPLRAFHARWPESHFLHTGQSATRLAEKFIANLYPSPQHLLDAYLAWFEELFAKPARAAGQPRWGLKEVRLSADHATFLRWLYPQARLLFVIRNPYDAFRSYAARRDSGWKWYHRWPAHPVTPELFGRHWRELTSSFLAAGEALGGLVVHYEDLPHGGWQAIRDYLGFELSAAAINANPSDGGPPPLHQLSPSDLAPLRTAVEPLASELGYFEHQERETERPGDGGTERQRDGGTEGQSDSNTNTKTLPLSPSLPPSVSPSPSTPPSVSPSPPPPSRCSILVPFSDRIEPACEASLRELENRGYRVERVHGYRQIDLARCQLATAALAAGCEETLWIDADTSFHPDMVERLRAHDVPIVCGIYPKKSKRELAIHSLPGTQEITFGKSGGLLEILYAPTGFLRIRREVYDTIRTRLHLPECHTESGQKLFPYFAPLIRPDGDGWWYLAEDFSFCERARQCGYTIVADTSIRLLHLGSYAYSWEDTSPQVKRYSTYHFHLK